MPPIEFANHWQIDAFDVIDGELAIAGLKISRITERVGGTPFYAYSRDAIRRRVAELRAALPPDLKLHYAVKANPMPAVVQLLASLTDGLDVASVNEMHVALNSGVEPCHVSFAGPGKTAREIHQAVAAGIVLNVESELQARQAIEAGERLGVAPCIAIRVNPEFELKASGMRMSGGPKPFGIDVDQVQKVIDLVYSHDLKISGLHIFCGAQNLNADALVEAQGKAFELGSTIAGRLRAALDWLNIGGGFGVPYFPGEKPLELAPVADGLEALCRRAKSELEAPLVLELGRYLVSDAGVYVCRIIDRKLSHGQVFLVADGGLHHQLSASGNFGQVLRKNYPVAIVNRLGTARSEAQTVVGPLCTPLDLLADRMTLAPAEIGDLVGVFQSGAYGLTASPTAFLSHPPPAEVLL